ncbi:hypothetical protein [Pseudoxanthomonas sp.]|jgi:hypothetical protein|uniref:hypothetical protein n=1 Tax=Pseudoxanthomonas sp. TaxID=1871049 RepID=UPI002FE322F1
MMQPLVLLLALASAPDPDMPHSIPDNTTACVVQRLKPFMSPYGIRQAWPVMASPPPELLNTLGSPMSDMGHIADGYQQFLHVDAQARAVYVVEQGGFAGTTKVFGPLPLPRCAPDAPPASTRPR